MRRSARVILHLDMDAFYAAVEVREDPALAGKPLIVGHPGRRGVVTTCSYEARKLGVRSAMPSVIAERLCPEALWLPVRMDLYVEVSRRIRRILDDFSPLVQPISIDEAFLDLSGIAMDLESGRAAGAAIKERILREERLTASVGIAPNKFLAKVASDMEKPDGLTLLSHDLLPSRLWPLPIERLWGVGPATGARLRRCGLRTIGQLAEVAEADLAAIVGAGSAAHLHALARGEDERPVVVDAEAKSLSEERTYGEDLRDPREIDRALLARSEGVARQLRRERLAGRTVHLKVRTGDFETWTRSSTLREPTDLAETIVLAARTLYAERIDTGGRGIRLLGVGVSRLQPALDGQRSLFGDAREGAARRLAAAADAVRDRLGEGSLVRGSLVRRRPRRLVPLLLLSFLSATSLVAAPASEVPVEWRTRAEASGFRATSSYDETIAFLKRIEKAAREVKLDYFGTSAQGRPLPLVIVSKDRAFTPKTARASGLPIVLIQSGIHAGEIDGKDATLSILRDLALGRGREILDGVILLATPMFNADGHERVSPYNRPNQDGPTEGMGFRTTADGHDLNRDHLKLETAEARAMVGLFNAWRPHLHVDNHVTDGVDHDWVLTYTWVESPQVPSSVGEWLASHMPRVLEATASAGHRIGPYVDLIDKSDPSRGFTSYIGQPRYATGYYPLRNRPSILVETHSYKPFGARVAANRDFLLALLREIAGGPGSLVDAVAQAESRVVALGRLIAPPSNIVLRYEPLDTRDKIRYPIYAWEVGPSMTMGTPLVRYRRGEVREIEVPWIHGSKNDVTLRRPRGYLLAPGWPAIERRIGDHGLVGHRLAAAVELEAETLRIAEPRKAPDSWQFTYQGLTPIEVQVERQSERREFPAGSLWIPADQPDFEVAVQLLEPEAPDSLVSWGLLSIVMERKEWIDPRRLEELAAELVGDPQIADAWKRALAEPAFAADPQARYAWWFRRTPYRDETVGLLPYARVHALPPAFPLTPLPPLPSLRH